MGDMNRIRELIKDLYQTRLTKKQVETNEDRLKKELESLIGDQQIVNVTDYILIKNNRRREMLSKTKFIEVYGKEDMAKVTEEINYSTLEVKKLA